MVALAILVLLAIGLRLIPILIIPSLNWPDEIFQTTEQAHRLVYGTGLVPWEFQRGIRSWLVPGMIAGLMEVARIGGDGPAYYLPVIAITLAALSATSAICCFLWCRRFFGISGAIVGAAVVAVTPDLVYLGARSLTEVVAAHILVLAFYMLEPGYRVTSQRRLLLGGGLLGLVFILRVHLAPALAVVALAVAARDFRHRLPAILLGYLFPVALGTILDTVTLGAPMASIWRYIIDNIYYGVSAFSGDRPWDFYATFEFQLWHFALAVPLLLALVGAWHLPSMLAAAIIIVATHSAIDHKEYRFIYPAILLVMVLAGIGLAQIAHGAAQTLHRWKPRVAARSFCAIAFVAYWGLLSFQVWTGPGFTFLRNIAHDGLAAASSVARDPQVCGVGLYNGPPGKGWIYGSYTYLHRPVPRYWPKDAAELAETVPAFNTLIYTAPAPEGLGFTTSQCFGEVCIAHRPGTCATLPMPSLPLPEPLQ